MLGRQWGGEAEGRDWEAKGERQRERDPSCFGMDRRGSYVATMPL